MSKAEQRGLEAYPIVISEYSDNCKEYDVNESDRIVYIEGYHQAEKDLDVVSWIKEVSGVKELSRAKEEALKAYPPQSIAANYDTIARRDAFEYGYLKAEKDLELTWEDLKMIDEISDQVYAECDVDAFDEKEYYQEILNRFKKLI